MSIQKIKKINNTYVWYSGFTDDLLFYIYIDTLFYTIVKGFSAAQIVSISTISLIIGIILQKPLLKVIKRIGNTYSIRLGTFFLVLSSVFITFCKNYALVVLGKVFYEIAFTFKTMDSVMIKNNLSLISKQDEYMSVKSRAYTCYAVFTAVISLVSSYMFNLNNYLPMICCIVCTMIGFILSFKIKDVSEEVKDKTSRNNVNNKAKNKKVKITKTIFYIILSFAIFYPIVNSSQSNFKLFIQQEMLKTYDVELTAIYLGIIIAISRIVRILSNVLFGRVSKKIKEDTTIILPMFLCISIIFVIIGFNVTNSLALKFTLMAIGYLIILGVRDPFKIYMNNLLLENSRKEDQQTILTYMEISRKIVRAILSLVISIMLIDLEMIYVVLLLAIISIVEVFVGIKLYSLVYRKR